MNSGNDPTSVYGRAPESGLADPRLEDEPGNELDSEPGGKQQSRRLLPVGHMPHIVAVVLVVAVALVAIWQINPWSTGEQARPEDTTVAESVSAVEAGSEFCGVIGADQTSGAVAQEGSSTAGRTAPISRSADSQAADTDRKDTTTGSNDGSSDDGGNLGFRSYTVRDGDTMGGIAERFGVSANTIVWANGMDNNPDMLQVGQELQVPPVSGVTHTVVEGDTVSTLAEHYEVDVTVIVEANDLILPYMIAAGQTLFIPGGVKPPPAAGVATGKFIWPSYGNITFYFREDGQHKGLDIGNGFGTPIYAADGGVVTTAVAMDNGYGWHVIVDHGNGYSTLYGHLCEMYVEYGDRVRRGDLLGLMGSTGYSTGPHLHFEVRWLGDFTDPLEVLP